MTIATWIYAAVSMLLFIFIICVLPKFTMTWFRTLVVICYTLVTISLYASYTLMLGKPKPVELTYLEETGELISAYYVENKGLYLWVLFPSSEEPEYLQLPWDTKMAEETLGWNEAIASGAEIEVTKSYNEGFGLGTGIEIHEQPVTPNPPKF